MDKVPLFFHEKYSEYTFGKLHPFKPERFPRFVEEVKNDDRLKEMIEVVDAPSVDDQILKTVHTPEYIDGVKEKESIGGALSMDTPVKKGTPDAARRIVGGSLEAAKYFNKHDFAINLGGLHHAGPGYGEGFCIFNDVAVAAQHLVQDDKKVVIFDTDAHQGNGTMDIFWKDPQVLFISIHQDPTTLYPGRGHVREIGEDEGKGYTVNIPLPRNANISDYNYAIEEVVKPIIEQFSPDVLIRNGGSDPHHADSLTDLALDMGGLKYLGEISRKMAEKVDAAYLDLMLSGYGSKVVEGWKAITIGCLGVDMPLPSDEKTGDIDNDPKNKVVEDVNRLKEILSEDWDF